MRKVFKRKYLKSKGVEVGGRQKSNLGKGNRSQEDTWYFRELKTGCPEFRAGKKYDVRRGQRRDYILHGVADCVIVFIYRKSNRKP